MSLALPENFFRHEYGRLVAILVRRFGTQHLETIEDAVQSALLVALESWTRRGLPDQPSAWLFRVASNQLVGELRKSAHRGSLLAQRGLDDFQEADAPTVTLTDEVGDELLRMLLVCCDASIPIESQLAIALKTLCGFDVREIAARLFTTEANVYKRLDRARSRLRELPYAPGELSAAELAERVPALQSVLYLLFTEGYLSAHAEEAIRRDLCDEAIRLAHVLVEHPVGKTPTTFALLALMHLHAARMGARQDHSGGLLLLAEQDRALWDRHEIETGLTWLAQSAEGDVFSRFHAEAGIAAEHCLAASLEETRWDRIVACYELLETVAPSSLHTLNRAVAVAEWQGPAAGLAILSGHAPPAWLSGSYLWMAVLADLHRRCGNVQQAERHREAALAAAPSTAVRDLLDRRLGSEPHEERE